MESPLSIPPFLEKLLQLVSSCDPRYGCWSENGKEFVVCSDEFEEKVLKQFFKGTLKTFIRQLHFYSFRKSETIRGKWSFSHPKFLRDFPEMTREIKRKTRHNNSTFCTKAELEEVELSVTKLRRDIEIELASMKNQLNEYLKSAAMVRESKEHPSFSSSGLTQAHFNPAQQNAASTEPVTDSDSNEDSSSNTQQNKSYGLPFRPMPWPHSHQIFPPMMPFQVPPPRHYHGPPLGFYGQPPSNSRMLPFNRHPNLYPFNQDSQNPKPSSSRLGTNRGDRRRIVRKRKKGYTVDLTVKKKRPMKNGNANTSNVHIAPMDDTSYQMYSDDSSG